MSCHKVTRGVFALSQPRQRSCHLEHAIAPSSQRALHGRHLVFPVNRNPTDGYKSKTDIQEPLGFQTSNPMGLIGPSSLRMGGEAAQETVTRRQIDAVHATITKTWSPSNRAIPFWGPGQDPWGLGDWEVENPPMDLRQHPDVPFRRPED